MMALPFEPERVMALVGAAKNAGKTTSLNWLTRSLHADGHVVGLFSIGYDGESNDFWLGIEKPPVEVQPGTLVAGAERLIEKATARMEVLERSEITSPLGAVVIARAETEGHVALAGLRHSADWIWVRDRLLATGADHVLIDGAYHRRALADPTLADGVILATGAVLAKTAEGVGRATAKLMQRLHLPRHASDTEQKLLSQAIQRGAPVWQNEQGETVEEQVRAAAMTLDALRDLADTSRVVAIPGAVSDRTLDAFAAHRPAALLLLRDATRLVVSDRSWERFVANEGSVRVARAIDVLAITVNPKGILHEDLDANALIARIQQDFPDTPVLDVASQGA